MAFAPILVHKLYYLGYPSLQGPSGPFSLGSTHEQSISNPWVIHEGPYAVYRLAEIQTLRTGMLPPKVENHETQTSFTFRQTKIHTSGGECEANGSPPDQSEK